MAMQRGNCARRLQKLSGHVAANVTAGGGLDAKKRGYGLLGEVKTTTFATSAPSPEGPGHSHLVALFESFREELAGDRHLEMATSAHGRALTLPDFSAGSMDAELRKLQGFQSQLRSFDASSWPISEQIDFHLVRAEMNGLEFEHKVLHPWATDPGFYNDAIAKLGIAEKKGQIQVTLPLSAVDHSRLQRGLEAVRPIVEQAKANLSVGIAAISADLARLAVFMLGDTQLSYAKLLELVPQHHPDLQPHCAAAAKAVDDYIAWIKGNLSAMVGRVGVGRANYDWLMTNVYMFPYTWDQIRMIVELEDNRVWSFFRLEENRNSSVAPIVPNNSQAEYRASVKNSIRHLLHFLQKQEILSLEGMPTADQIVSNDPVAPGAGQYFGAGEHLFHEPWPPSIGEKHDYFFNFSYRECVLEEAHEMVGHHFDSIRQEADRRPIRSSSRLYKIGTDREEGFAFGLEELLIHAGLLDGRNPHGREVAYEQAAFRTVRAMSDIMMHGHVWDLDESMRYCVAKAPHGELLENSHHLWFELETTLRGVGHHMVMIVGKALLLHLFRDQSTLLGKKFVLRNFMDEVANSGQIPFSLIRWEMTGLDDEVSRLLPPPGSLAIGTL